MKQELTCGILPLKFDGKNWQIFLVLHRKGHYWGFPKGHRDAHESFLETASRELKEETGMEVLSWIETNPFVDQYSFMREEVHIQKTVYYFVARVSVESELDKNEILDGKWLDLDQAYQQLTFDSSKKIMQQLQAFLQMLQ